MHWKRKSKLNLNGVYSKHSLSKKLKEEGKSSDEFEFYIGRLSLEELIALKLEVSARMLGGKLYGFNIWSAMPKIAKDANSKAEEMELGSYLSDTWWVNDHGP
jgi:hypothetical protein